MFKGVELRPSGNGRWGVFDISSNQFFPGYFVKEESKSMFDSVIREISRTLRQDPSNLYDLAINGYFYSHWQHDKYRQWRHFDTWVGLNPGFMEFLNSKISEAEKKKKKTKADKVKVRQAVKKTPRKKVTKR